MKLLKPISSTLTSQVSKDTSIQLLSRGVIVVISTAVTVLIRRNYTAAQYGEYIYILNIIMLLSSFLDIGTHLTLVRETATSLKTKASIITNFIGTRTMLLIAVLAVFAISAVSPWSSYLIKQHWAKVILILIALATKDILAAVYHSLKQLATTSWLHTLTSISMFLSTGIVLISNQPVTTIFKYQAILTVGFVSRYVYIIGKTKFHINKISISKIKYLLNQSIPLGLTLITFTMYSKLDTILIEYYYSVEEVGVYGLSYKIYENLILPAAFLLNALLSRISHQAKHDLVQLKKTIKKTATLLILVGICIVIAIFIFSPTIVYILTGENSLQEVYILKILSIAAVVAYLNHLTGYVIVALKLQKKAFKIAAVALIANLTLNVLLLPRIGFQAAAFITIITELIVLGGTTKVIQKALKKTS